MFSILNVVLVVIICILGGGFVWLGRQYLASQGEVDRLTKKLNRFAKKQQVKQAKAAGPPYEQILNLIPGGLIVSDREGRIIWHNPEAATILNMNLADVHGRSIMNLLSPLPMLISNGLGESEMAPAEFDYNGRRIQGMIFVLYGKGGLDQGTVAILNDVTTWHAALLAKQKQLDEINHELRQRLTSMGSFTEMLGGDGDRADNKWLPRLHDTVGRVTELIDTIMRISAVKSDGGNLAHVLVDVPQVVEETLEWLKPEIEEKQILLKQQIDPNMRPIKAQPVHIQTMMKELLTNSIRFNRPGGMVQIRAATQRDEDSNLDFFVLMVNDDGYGIPADDQKKIFNIFYRPEAMAHSKHRNIGVGLAIVHAIVEAYDGRIWFKSQEGKGTSFTILLPVGLTAEDSLIETSEEPAEAATDEADEFAWVEDTP